MPVRSVDGGPVLPTPTTAAPTVAATPASPPVAAPVVSLPTPDAPAVPGAPLKPVGTTTAGQTGSALALQMATLKERATTTEVMRGAAKSLTARATALESRRGVGFEHWGTGDPDVLTRRALLGQLAAAPADLRPNPLLEKPFAARDLRLHRRFEQRDQQKALAASIKEAVGLLRSLNAGGVATSIEAKAKRNELKTYNDLANEVWKAHPPGNKREQVEALYYTLVLEDRMAQNAKVNGERAQTALTGLLSGERRFFEVDPQRFSTAILPLITDADLRARTLTDMLLQFREPIARNTTREKDTAGGAGVQSVHEMRAYAALIEPAFGDPKAEREYALARAVVNANPISSSNAVLEARHLVGKLRRMSWELVYGEAAKPAGTSNTPYEAIHHNFSIETPKIIEAFTGDVVFGGGDPRTFCRLVDALGVLAAGKQPAEGQRLLDAALRSDPGIAAEYAAYAAAHAGPTPAATLEAFLVSRCKGKLDSGNVGASHLTADEKKHLEKGNLSTVKGQYREKLELVARLYRTLCESLPSAATLSDVLFSAKGATGAVAEAIAHLQSPDAPVVATLQSLTSARAAVRAELSAHPEGHNRVELLRVDKQLEALTSTHLGALVEQLGDIKTDAARVDALAGMQLALASARLSGLDAIKDLGDPKALRGPKLGEVADEIQALFAAGSVDLGTYQATMARAYEAIVRASENVRAYVDGRVPDVSEGSLIPNPSFMDDLIKEGPLHYARAIGQKALKVGLEAEMSPKKIVNPDGVAVLNPLGRVVFDRVLVADSMSDLAELGAGRSDMCWVRKMDEKKMMAVGGIMSDFPGGYCHAAVYARGAGIAALSNPELSAQWMAFVENLEKDKLYYDDTGGRIVMMPLSEATQQGLVKPGEADKLKPGSNRQVKYYSWDEALQKYQTVGSHAVVVDLERSTDVVELYGTTTPIMGKGEKCMSFAEIGEMGTAARALFGEKSLVLSLMSQEPELKEFVPPGSAISTLRVQRMLADAGLLEKWTSLWEHDPEVGKIDDANFLESRFYTDDQYRKDKREEMSAAVKGGLAALFIGADGQPTAKGAELLAELRANPELAACDNWIVRSSFTAEDRPGKSGAGQYDSFPNCKSDREILEGVIGVIASAWEAPPVENNVREEYNLSRIWPAITVMKCLAPEYSGVMVSRDTGTGHRRTASYQAVEGFGGGVEEGVTEQGKIREGGHNELAHLIAGKSTALVGDDMAARLWTIANATERLFHRKVEPGRGMAVDMEWCVEKGQLYLVQARTIRA